MGRRWAAVAMTAVLAGCTSPGAQGQQPATRPATITQSPGPSSDPGPSSSPSPAPIPSPSPSASPSSAKTHQYAFPVGGNPVSYHRTHSGYAATDIFANCGSPVRAVTDGVVLEVSRVDRYDPARNDPALRGGLFVSVKGDDGVRYYGAHLVEVAAGIDKGVRVRSGQNLGAVGKTGNASNVCHLHFGISPPCTGADDWWIRRGVVWPWSYLDAWRGGADKSPVAAVSAWHKQHGCPPAP